MTKVRDWIFSFDLLQVEYFWDRENDLCFSTILSSVINHLRFPLKIENVIGPSSWPAVLYGFEMKCSHFVIRIWIFGSSAHCWGERVFLYLFSLPRSIRVMSTLQKNKPQQWDWESGSIHLSLCYGSKDNHVDIPHRLEYGLWRLGRELGFRGWARMSTWLFLAL